MIWWASFVAAFVAFGASVYSQHGEDSGPSQSLTFVQFPSLYTEHALRKVHSQSHFFLFFQDSPNSFLWLSLVLHWFRVLLLFTGPTQSTPFMQKLGRVWRNLPRTATPGGSPSGRSFQHSLESPPWHY